ncbi:MAG: sulfurtransferase/chromate resistance protein [Sneathiella sp.]
MTDFISLIPETVLSMIGTPDCPPIIDVRIDEDFDADPRLIPSARRYSHHTIKDWMPYYQGQSVLVYCDRGLKLSEGVAALMREAGIDAKSIRGGGFQGWRSEGLPLVPYQKIPKRNEEGRTLWVTRTRPKIDRIACPWLIRRFIDPDAAFLFVSADQVKDVADRFDGSPFDIEDTFWSHDGERCSFDKMVAQFEIGSVALDRVSQIVRGADTAKLDLAPEASGLLAISLGLSQMCHDDLQQLEAGMLIYDALYHWARDAIDEGHNWPSVQAGKVA